MSNYYIVQKIGWQYNDEYYYNDGDGGGSPERVFQDSDKAEALADELNAKELSGNEIGCYACDGQLSEVLGDIPRFVELYNQVFKGNLTESSLDDNYEFEMPKLTLAQYKKLKPVLKLRFYEVAECPGE